jgi:hypothetical protein
VEDRVTLQPAIAMDQVSGFGETRRERRQARKAERQERRSTRREDRQAKRDDRKTARQEKRGERQSAREEKRDARLTKKEDRKLARVERKQDRVRDKLQELPDAPPPRRPFRRRPAPEPTLQPAVPPAWPTSPAAPVAPVEQAWTEDMWEEADEMMEEVEEAPPDEEIEDATEGIGAFQPFAAVRRAVAPKRARTAPGVDAASWGPAVKMGTNLRIQSAAGHRAAVIQLRPGLHLVAEIPEAATRTEFGLAPLLAPMMVNAARSALDEPPRERRGPLSALFRRRQDAPLRYVEVQQQPAPAPAVPALPGPAPSTMLVAAPDVGWADDRSVAAAYGCQCRERR